MDVFEAIKDRRSIRAYQDKLVEKEKLMKVLEAARLAPSAKNMQDWRFVVVQDLETRKKLAEAAAQQGFVAEAPVIIVCCTVQPDYVMRCGQPAGTINVAIAIDHMILAAQALGLGTCWVGAFYADQVRELLKIPENVGIVELLTLGYPAKHPHPTSRLSIHEIVRWGKWD